MRFFLGRLGLLAPVLLVIQASAAPAPDYSKEPVVIQEFSKEIDFAADGTWRAEQNAAVRIQSEAGVRQLGVLSFPYKGESESLEVVYVRVRKPDGSVVQTSADNIQDVSSEITRMAPTYSDLREKQIPVKALGVGDILEYKVASNGQKPEIPGQFWYAEDFISGVIALKETLRISFPANKYVKVSSPSVQPEVREEAGRKIYSWATAQLEPTGQENDKKKASSQPKPPAVQLTTFKSWEEVGRWYGQLQADRIAVTPAIQAKAAELTKGLTTDTEKQRALYDYVSTKFRYISISLGAGRYQPHPAADVLANQYGDCKDKHTLLASLLKATGIEAWPALIGAGIKLDPDIPSPAHFNHVITVIPKEGRYTWLDTTPEVAPFGLLQAILRDKQALVIPAGGPAVLMTTPAEPALANLETVQVKASLSADGTLRGHFEITAQGDNDLALRTAFHQLPPSQWQEGVQAIVNSLGFAGTVSNVDIGNPENLEKPFHFSYDYVRNNYSDWANKRISPPLFPMGFPLADSEEKPADPIELNAPSEFDYSATVELPKNFSAEIPSGTNLKTDFAEYASSYSVTNGVLSAKRQIVLKKAKVPVSAWDAYKKFTKDAWDDQSQFIQLAASTGPLKTTVVENNSEAATLIWNANVALQTGNLSGAREDLAKAEKINPKQEKLWAIYSSLYMLEHEPEKAVEADRKEIQYHPDELPAYRVSAYLLTMLHRNDEAIAVLRKLLEVAPDDSDALLRLSGLLMTTKRYQEVTTLLHDALRKTPDNVELQILSAEALLRSGQKQEGTAACQELAKTSSDGNVLNSVAWNLVDTDTDLPLAQEYAEKSVSLLEGITKEVTLSNLTNEDLQHVVELAAAWDTLGWIYFQRGDVDRAEKYVNASWHLVQQGLVADHLGQIYAKQGKQDAAIHAWKLALAADNTLEATRERLRKSGVVSEKPKIISTSKKSATVQVKNSFVAPEEELSKLRSAAIPELPKQESSAEFWILVSPRKIEDAQFISGGDALKSAGTALGNAHYDLPFPDDGPEKIARRGILSCSTYTTPSCQFVLLLPSTTRK